MGQLCSCVVFPGFSLVHPPALLGPRPVSAIEQFRAESGCCVKMYENMSAGIKINQAALLLPIEFSSRTKMKRQQEAVSPDLIHKDQK